MLKGQTTIGKVLARCPTGTEPLAARLRLSHLFSGADLAPRGFPPRAVLVIRRAKATHTVALASHGLRTVWEREMREQVAALWRRAARPVRGRVPEWAEAVLFADEGEWLAALGLAVARQEFGSHWCWRDGHRSLAAFVPSQALTRAWIESPRFLPAALVNLAQWGEAARVLNILSPVEAGALLSALRSEFDLPHPLQASSSHAVHTSNRRDAQATRARDAGRRRLRDGEDRVSVASNDEERGGQFEETVGGASVAESRASSPPWRRWLPSDGGTCEQLHATARSLLSFAAALFHAPALARSRDFAEEVFAFNEHSVTRLRPSFDDTGAARAPVSKPGAHNAGVVHSADHASVDEGRRVAPSADAADAAARDAARARSSDMNAPSRSTRDEASASRVEESLTTHPTRGLDEDESKGALNIQAVVEGDAEEDANDAHAAPWAQLNGCETRLGGALFLLNLLMGLRLPECFDQEYQLSDHLTGWGLTELLTRELLGETVEEYEDDPLWGALAHLDGREGVEPPAAGLRVGASYRAPARWLKLFAPREGEEVWLVEVDASRVAESRLVLRHPAGFPVAVLPLEGRAPSEVAAQVADEYRAHGLRGSWRLSSESSERGDALPHGRAYSEDLRRWMSWTFPFIKYVLRRSLADAGEGEASAESVRALFVRRGRLYCTATHVDLMLEMSGVSFEARRAGLDASPGWVRDLMRVVAFHYE